MKYCDLPRRSLGVGGLLRELILKDKSKWDEVL